MGTLDVKIACEHLLDKVLYCQKKNGRDFTAKLIDVRGDDLIFQNRRGAIIVDKFTDLVLIAPLKRDQHDN